MKSSVHWLMWILLIILIVYSFPKPCGYRIFENNELILKSGNIEYDCLGFEDHLLTKMKENSTVQFCYGFCLENSIESEEVNNTPINSGGTPLPDILVETLKGLSKALFIFIIIVLLIIFFMILKPIFKRN